MRANAVALMGFLLLSPFSMAWGDAVNQIVVFGDSLSDNGNAAAALGGQFSFNGSTNYAKNAATNGPNTIPPVPSGGPYGLWVDQLATKVGLADPQPFTQLTASGLAPNFNGTNFAVGSADTGSNPNFNLSTVFTNPQVPFVSDQLSLFNAFNVHNGTLPNPNALYTFWAGANDIADLKSPITAANNIMANIQTLAGEGAKTFLWVNLPDLGAVPAVNTNPVLSAFATAQSNAFDAQFAQDVMVLQQQNHINVIPVDVNQLFAQIVDNPSKFNFSNVMDAAQGNSAVNPNTYLFWDGEHPTTEADSLVADLAASDLTAAGVVATPEPPSVTFAVIGGLILGALVLRKRFRKTTT